MIKKFTKPTHVVVILSHTHLLGSVQEGHRFQGGGRMKELIRIQIRYNGLLRKAKWFQEVDNH